MKFVSIVVSFVTALGGMVVLHPNSAQAASLSFNVFNFTGDTAQAKVTLTEIDQAIQFEIDVIPSPNIGDLRGVFFNIADDSLISGLSVTGNNLGNTQFSAGSVINLGGGATLSGYANGKFDAGIEIGKAGIGKGDDFQSAAFTLSHTSAVLTLSQFANQFFGVRITSVGELGSSRDGSSKLAGVVPTPPDDSEEPTEVPEPGAALALGLVGIGAWRLKRNG
jgi:hypothetical protein